MLAVPGDNCIVYIVSPCSATVVLVAIDAECIVASVDEA